MTKNRKYHTAAISVVKYRANKIQLKQLTLTCLEDACRGQVPSEVIDMTGVSPSVLSGLEFLSTPPKRAQVNP